jgi:hypothetical protein
MIALVTQPQRHRLHYPRRHHEHHCIDMLCSHVPFVALTDSPSPEHTYGRWRWCAVTAFADKVIGVTTSDDVMIVGTLYKDMALKPNILDEFVSEVSPIPRGSRALYLAVVASVAATRCVCVFHVNLVVMPLPAHVMLTRLSVVVHMTVCSAKSRRLLLAATTAAPPTRCSSRTSLGACH